jgi:hypothetical protein
VSDFTPFIQSHPSARVRQLLASAELDAPPAGSKHRALVALAQLDHHAATTDFSGVALGTTVHRLLGAVTLYGSTASPWRLIMRGSMVGAAAGAMALAAIVAVRWTHSPADRKFDLAQMQPATARMVGSVSETELVQQATRELDAGRAARALTLLDAYSRSRASLTYLPQSIVLRVKALKALGRDAEAAVVAKPLLERGTSPEAAEVRALLNIQSPDTIPATSAQ